MKFLKDKNKALICANEGYLSALLNSSERYQLRSYDVEKCEFNAKAEKESRGELEEEKPRVLYILLHGIDGHSTNLRFIASAIANNCKAQNQPYFIYLSSLKGETHKGINYGGDIIVERLVELVELHPSLQFYSIIGHSMGGLYGRYVAAKLQNRENFASMQPLDYVSLATPHIGSRRSTGWSLNGRFQFSLFQSVTDNFFGFSGKQLLLEDKEDLLFKMATEEEYLAPLRRFRQRILYSNCRNDRIVSYCTGAICFYFPEVPIRSRCFRAAKKYSNLIAVHSHECNCFKGQSTLVLQEMSNKSQPSVEALPNDIQSEEETNQVNSPHLTTIELFKKRRRGSSFTDFPRLQYDKQKHKLYSMVQSLQKLSWIRVDVSISYGDPLKSDSFKENVDRNNSVPLFEGLGKSGVQSSPPVMRTFSVAPGMPKNSPNISVSRFNPSNTFQAHVDIVVKDKSRKCGWDVVRHLADNCMWKTEHEKEDVLVEDNTLAVPLISVS